MAEINLEELTMGKVHNLSGRLRGLAAREKFGLDKFDREGQTVQVRVPNYVYAVTPSFVQGLFGESLKIRNWNVDTFRQTYRFIAPAIVLDQLERGISAITTSRDVADIN